MIVRVHNCIHINDFNVCEYVCVCVFLLLVFAVAVLNCDKLLYNAFIYSATCNRGQYQR